jgi:MYXO-CTERM domain-containing protein
MFANATEVVLMRDGTKTVLSMQNDYAGPLEDFAMVVPVPVVLHEQDVKTLPKEVFAHVDSLGSPRLVEYWEQDPCYVARPMKSAKAGMPTGGMDREESVTEKRKQTVKIEAKFDVAEYQILILSATDSTGLEQWLRDNHYKIPAAAGPLLRPYVEAGSKFFVAKVDAKKVAMVEGRAALNPLRFHYDSEEFALPIRLGMANSSGKQDLIVNILSADKRFEVANYKNVTIPTNFDVKNVVKSRFAEFYAALFDRTVEANPGAVVTEYAWTAVPQYHCDPCPELDVNQGDVMSLGGDVVGGQLAQGTFVLTRLHARYGAADMKDDLRFRAAKPITGGREEWQAGQLEHGAKDSAQNYFQGRYAIRHAWTGPVKCAHPQRGVWGGPPDGGAGQLIVASKLAYAPRGKLALGEVVKRDLPEIGVRRTASPAPTGGAKSVPSVPTSPASPPGKKAMDAGLGALAGLALLGLGRAASRRRRRAGGARDDARDDGARS